MPLNAPAPGAWVKITLKAKDVNGVSMIWCGELENRDDSGFTIGNGSNSAYGHETLRGAWIEIEKMEVAPKEMVGVYKSNQP